MKNHNMSKIVFLALLAVGIAFQTHAMHPMDMTKREFARAQIQLRKITEKEQYLKQANRCLNMSPPALNLAAALGYTEALSYLLGTGRYSIDTNPEGFTPLMAASLNGQIDAVKLLVEKGANIEMTSIADQTALMIAIEKGHERITHILLDAQERLDTLARAAKQNRLRQKNKEDECARGLSIRSSLFVAGGATSRPTLFCEPKIQARTVASPEPQAPEPEEEEEEEKADILGYENIPQRQPEEAESGDGGYENGSGEEVNVDDWLARRYR